MSYFPIINNQTEIVVSTTPLSSGGSITSPIYDLQGFVEFDVKVEGDGTGASLFIDLSVNGTDWLSSVPYVVREQTFFLPIKLSVVERYVRVRFYNDGGALAIAALGLDETAQVATGQTFFRFYAYKFNSITPPLGRSIDATIQGSDNAELGLSMQFGQDPNGEYIKQPLSGHSQPNKTSTPLGANGVFTGEFADTTGYLQVDVTVFSDVDGVLTIQRSEDGVTISKATNYTVLGNQAFSISVPALSDLYKVIYTNGAIAQTVFELHTALKISAHNATIRDANTPITPQSLVTASISIPQDGVQPTYVVGIVGLAPTNNNTTDIFSMSGSATRTIKITRVFINGTAGADTTQNVVLLKRSTANTGGTPTTYTPTKYDSNDIASTVASVTTYGTNPATGTLVGNLLTEKIFLDSGNALGNSMDVTFGDRNSKAITLRGVNEFFCINFNTQTVNTKSINITVEWVELPQ